MIRQTGIALTASLLSVLFIDGAAADDVYRWVDEDGVVQFSQWAPESHAGTVSTVNIETSTPRDYDPHDDPYSILNQAARIHDRWSELQAEKEEAREKARERTEPGRAPFRDGDDYFSFPLRFGHFAHFRARDTFPVQRKQLEVLEEFDRLPIPRAASINSSWHHARVSAQQQVLREVILGRDH